jgi:hypothetical protein
MPEGKGVEEEREWRRMPEALDAQYCRRKSRCSVLRKVNERGSGRAERQSMSRGGGGGGGGGERGIF